MRQLKQPFMEEFSGTPEARVKVRQFYQYQICLKL